MQGTSVDSCVMISDRTKIDTDNGKRSSSAPDVLSFMSFSSFHLRKSSRDIRDTTVTVYMSICPVCRNPSKNANSYSLVHWKQHANTST